jgi:molybdopterin-guanine dinucleotide biosynthesis protein A
MSAAAAPLYGLVLAGGSSSRMHRDKAALLYQGKVQLDRALELVTRHVERAFVSVRSGQVSESTRATKPLIIDSVNGEGPIVGIRSALGAHPDVAWLVLACDLPFLSDATLRQLEKGRDPSALATAFRSAHDGLPEPLCAIWEPAAAPALATYQDGGGRCPRKFLMSHAVRLLDLDDHQALDNINTPDEYAQAQALIAADPIGATTASTASTASTACAAPTASTASTAPGATSASDATTAPTAPTASTAAGATTASAATTPWPKQLTVQYFALMREQAGRSHDTVETLAATPADLYSELTARYGFTLSREQLKVAVNSEFAEWSRKLAAGDTVVFIPPVAGG